MKKILNRISLILLMFIFVGCFSNEELGDYEVAVVETTSNVRKSLISFYDEDLNKVYSKPLRYGELGSHFYRPEFLGDKVFMVPTGIQGFDNDKKVISIDRLSGEIEEYRVDRNNIQCTAVSDEYLFAGSNLNFISYLTRTNFESKEVKEIEFKDEYLSLIVTSDKYVIAFLTSIKPGLTYSKINIYDIDSLDLIKSLDVSAIRRDQDKYYLDKNILYFSNQLAIEDVPTNRLGVLNLDDLTLSKIDLKFDFPSDIHYIGEDRLLVACSGEVIREGTKVIELNTKTGEQKVYDVGLPILTTHVSGNKLYVYSDDDKLNVYDINDGMKLIKGIEHKLTRGIYISAIFTKDK